MADRPTSPEVQYWSVPEAVNWIAFRAEPDQAPDTIIPDLTTARFILLDIIGAVNARAAANPRSWPPKGYQVKLPNWPALERLPDYPAWRCRAIVKRWMRDTKLTAPDLLVHATAEKHRYENDVKAATEQQAELSKALDGLNVAIASSRIAAFGRPSLTRSKPLSSPPREPIPAALIDELRRIDFAGCFHIREDGEEFEWLHDPGPFYYDVQVRASAVRRLWHGSAAAFKRPLPFPVLLAWWATYVKNHPDPDRRPNAKQQLADANAYFSAQGNKGPTVRAMQKLRADPPTPPEWREVGRLPKSEQEIETRISLQPDFD